METEKNDAAFLFCEKEPWMGKLLSEDEFLKEVRPCNDDVSVFDIDLTCDYVPFIVKG